MTARPQCTRALLLADTLDPPYVEAGSWSCYAELDDDAAGPAAVVQVSAESRARSVLAITENGWEQTVLSGSPPVFDGLSVHPAVLAALQGLGGTGRSMYPIAAVQGQLGRVDAGELAVFAHGGATLTARSRLYRRLAVVSPEDSSRRQHLRLMAELASASHAMVNWDDGFVTFAPETEIEQKIALDVHAPAPWALASAFAELVGRGRLPGVFLEPGNDLHQWRFTNHMFEVRKPSADAGYVSVLDDGSGSYLIKRKWFQIDALARREQISAPLTIPDGDFPAALAARYSGLDLHPMPPFTRSRMDVHVVSELTGNIYAVIFDRVQVHDGAAELRQVEVEYLRTYRHAPSSTDMDLDLDLQSLVNQVGRCLDSAGVAWARTTLSKLSFLRGLDHSRSGGRQ
jgi:hypothetical protein